MKKFLLPIVLLATTAINAQSDAPARREAAKTQTSEVLNFNQRIAELDMYWKSVPNDFKGSGIKVYERWKENWRHRVNSDGSLFSPAQIAEAWNRLNDIKFRQTEENTGEWIPLGPFNHSNVGSWSPGQGRVNISVIDPNNPNTIYVGSPDGGLWKSKDHGTSWNSLTDYLPSIGISGIAVDYNDSNIIYISTGDEDARDSYSDGVYKSIDGGATWNKLENLSGFTVSGEILMNPNDSNMLWVCTNGGLFKTTDAGETWTKVVSNVVKEIRLNPEDPNTIYIVVRVGTNSYIMKSTNAGDSFSQIHYATQAGRTVIATTPDDSGYLYVLYSNNDESYKALYKSTDSGESFIQIHSGEDLDIYDGSGQAFYDLAMTVSDTNKNEIFIGNLNIYKSSNGGNTFSRITVWNQPESPSYTHSDIHDLKFYNGKLYASTDGGIYISSDGGVNFDDKTHGLNISQLYRIDVAPETSSKIVGGLQDNGGFAFSNESWKVYHGADGMDAAIDPTDSNYYFGFIQNGGYLFVYDVVNNDGFAIASAPGVNGDWVTPLEFGGEGTLYAGYDKLYKLQLNDAQTQYSFVPVTKVISSTAPNFYKNLAIIRVDPTNEDNVLFSDEYRVYKTNPSSIDANGQMTYSVVNTPTGSQFWGNFITNIDFNKNDSNIIYVTTQSAVFKSIDGGESWTDITYNLPTEGVSNVTIAHQQNSPNNTIYLAQSNAVYYMDDTTEEWTLYNNNLPHTHIRDLEINSIENHLVIATYGRGVWRAPVVDNSLNDVDEEDNTDGEDTLNVEDYANLDLKAGDVFPNPIQNTAHVNLSIDEKATLQVFDLKGNVVLERKYDAILPNTDLDFTTLRNGQYILRITSPKHLVTKKILIRK
ncbi:T9SS type A sorting domain-containing protein [Aureivirga marina]|uniref:T9SS type A sorting domain-containing protein n=1 Tax=Aureivirga marina TaxID=1182451 RepID=UPI0018CA7B14|nr:T9SS type A sorting domain-containing protein [Aureivirga marina]